MPPTDARRRPRSPYTNRQKHAIIERMANFIVTATFSEERPVAAESREAAERREWERYARQPGILLEGLTVRAEEDTGEAAYRRLLAKAHCTIDYQAGAALRWMSAEARTEFIMGQIYYLCVTGYSREQVSQLVRDNFGKE